jgi:hypothetical protein
VLRHGHACPRRHQRAQRAHEYQRFPRPPLDTWPAVKSWTTEKGPALPQPAADGHRQRGEFAHRLDQVFAERLIEPRALIGDLNLQAPEPSVPVPSLATGRSCGALARACGRRVLPRHGRRRAPHHGPATGSDRGEDAMPDHRDPPPLAQSTPQDEPCGTSALGRAPPRPPLPSSGSARRTRSHPDPDRDPRP